MAYSQQIRILEEKLKQLEKLPNDKENISLYFELQTQIRKLKRLEWEEKYETIRMEEDR
jgi:hypothetical protein